MNWATIRLVLLVSAAVGSRGIVFAQDTDLRDLDVNHWSCLDNVPGPRPQPDEQERNLMKNRNPPGTLPLNVEQLDLASFLRKVAAYDAILSASRRADFDDTGKQRLLGFENQIVTRLAG